MTAPLTDAVDPAARVAAGRTRIDAIDAEIVRLVRERCAVSAQVQAARRVIGGPRIAQSRENAVVARYADALGRPGGTVALALLELGRGRPA